MKRTRKTMADLDSAYPKILKLMYEYYELLKSKILNSPWSPILAPRWAGHEK